MREADEREKRQEERTRRDETTTQMSQLSLDTCADGSSRLDLYFISTLHVLFSLPPQYV